MAVVAAALVLIVAVAPAHAALTVHLSNGDDDQRVYVNGSHVATAGYSQSRNVPLGDLTANDTVRVDVWNAGGPYSWGIRWSDEAGTIGNEEEGEVGVEGANDNDTSHTNQVVRSITLNGLGERCAEFEAGEEPYSYGCPTERARLDWDTDNTDIDLHIWDENGVHSWYGDRHAIAESELTTDIRYGFGPEHFYDEAERPSTRRFTYGLCFYDYNANGPAPPTTATVTVRDPGGGTRKLNHVLQRPGDGVLLTRSPDGAGYMPPDGWCQRLVRDADGDGAEDAVDGCPNEPGTDGGCPSRYPELDPEADADGDSLPNGWEAGGLARLGADPYTRDVFVHADWMRGCAPPEGWQRPVVAAFERQGIALHVDQGPESPNTDGPWGGRSAAAELDFDSSTDLWKEVDAAKRAGGYDRQARRDVFHYALFANSIEGAGDGVIGQARAAGDVSEGSHDFVVSVCQNDELRRSPHETGLTFMHELGHNLGLGHGGEDDMNDKPNYVSVMNYGWAQLGGVPLAAQPGRVGLDFSDRVLTTIDEKRVNERGVTQPALWWCSRDAQERRYEFLAPGEPVDLNCNGVVGEVGPFKRNVNGDSSCFVGICRDRLESLEGWDDWSSLVFHGGGRIGLLATSAPLPETTPVIPEPTVDDVARADETLAASVARERLRLRVKTKTRRLRRGRTTRVSIKVIAGDRSVKGAKVKVKGARVVGRLGRTDGKGRMVLKLRAGRARAVTLAVSRRGLLKSGLSVPVKR